MALRNIDKHNAFLLPYNRQQGVENIDSLISAKRQTDESRFAKLNLSGIMLSTALFFLLICTERTRKNGLFSCKDRSDGAEDRFLGK